MAEQAKRSTVNHAVAVGQAFSVKPFVEEFVMYRDRVVEFTALALLVLPIAAMYVGLLF